MSSYAAVFAPARQMRRASASASAPASRRASHRSSPHAPRTSAQPRDALPATLAHYPLCFNDLSFPNDLIRREHSPPHRPAGEHTRE